MIGKLFRKRDRFGDLLTDAASGRLDAGGLRQLDELAAQSAERQAARDETLALARLLHSQPMLQAPRSFTLPAPPAPRRPSAVARPIQAMTAAAAVALVALIAADFATVASSGAPVVSPYTAAIETSQDDAPAADPAGGLDAVPARAGEAEAAPSAAREADGNDPSGGADAQTKMDDASAELEKAAAREWSALDRAIAAAGLATAALALAHLTAVWLARRDL